MSQMQRAIDTEGGLGHWFWASVPIGSNRLGMPTGGLATLRCFSLVVVFQAMDLCCLIIEMALRF